MNKKVEPTVLFGRLVALSAVVLALSGCHIVPYQSKFMCEKSHNFGQCMDVQSAYEEAVAASASKHLSTVKRSDDSSMPLRYPSATTSTSTHPLKPLKGQQARVNSHQGPSGKLSNVLVNTDDLYRDAEYRELAALIEAPVTPLIRRTTMLQTLIVAYNFGDTLFHSRFIDYFVDGPRFVLGDYLNPPDTRPTVYPMGQKAARTNP